MYDTLATLLCNSPDLEPRHRRATHSVAVENKMVVFSGDFSVPAALKSYFLNENLRGNSQKPS